MTTQRIVLIPGTPALLPEFASLEDPIPRLRGAVQEAVAWLVELGEPVSVRCEPRARRIAEFLIPEAGGLDRLDQQAAVLVIGNGSACRTEKAPGYLDLRAASFDAALGDALRQPDPEALKATRGQLAAELLADTESIAWLGAEVLTPRHRAEVLYDDDPYGVQYWVVRWESGDG